MAEEPIRHLKTTIIKASIHCQGCKRKVHKILSQIQGVEHVDIDAQQHKVTVKGNVDADTLIKKLTKSGKNAQLWPQDKIIPTIGNKKETKTEEKVDAVEAPPASADKGKSKTPETAGDGAGGDVKKTSASAGADVKKPEEEKKSEESCSAAPEKKEAVEKSDGGGKGNGGASAKKKKKKKRVQIDGGLENREAGPLPASDESPSPCHNHFTPPAAAQPVCAVSYNTAYPSSSYTASYYTAPPPHAHAYMHQMEPPPLDSELNQPQPLDSFEMFSDENPNGCFIM